ncbi:MAG: GntR family transcriptional regulator [Kiritimatiellae bacterium]|nr:GntR family transcriptional regulator [Kiritimatiellia bacterium]
MKPSEQFSAWLRQRVETGKPGERLPTDDRLAEQFAISKSTVRRLVARYRADGRLTRIQGKGTFLPHPPPPAPVDMASAKSSAQTVADHLLKAIRAGELRRGQVLPPIKQMVYQLRVSAGTVQAAYRILQAEQVVVKAGRTFRVGGFKDVLHPEAVREVVLFCAKSADFAQLFTTDPLAQAYRKMERELLANGFVLRFEALAELEMRARLWRRRRRFPTGIVFSLRNHSDFEAVRDSWRRIVRSAAAFDRRAPRLLLDGSGTPLKRRPRGMHLIARGNVLTASARALAEYMVPRGCREANFFADPGNAMIVAHLAKYRAELKHLAPDFVFRIVAVPRADRRESPGSLARKLAASIAEPVTGLILKKYQDVPARILFDETAVLQDFAEVYTRFPKARLWVFMKDARAAEALQWATDARIDVPRGLSLISSEHDPVYYHLGLTCCFPDYEQIGYQMAHALIGDVPIARTSKGFIRTRALLVDQLTTAPRGVR